MAAKYTFSRSRGEPGFGKVLGLILAIWLFYCALLAGGIVGLLFLIRWIFF